MQPIYMELKLVKDFYINMKSLLQNSDKERDKCLLLFKTSFMKPLVAPFTPDSLFISFVSFFAVAARLISFIAQCKLIVPTNF